MKRITFLLLSVLIAGIAFAGTNGGFAGAFGRMGADARAKAMGNAFTGLAQGPSAVYFNPGAISFHTQREFTANLTDMALDRRLDFLAFTAPLHPKAGPEKRTLNAGVGLGWLHAGVGDIDSRDFDGNPLEMIDQSSNLFMFSFGIQFHEKFGAGLTGKMIYETFGKIGNEERSINGDGVGLDFGAYAEPIEYLSVGVLVKDIAAKTTWNTTDYWSQGSAKADDWPMQYRFGAAYSRSGLTGAVDLESSEQSETKLHFGAEAATDINENYSIAGRAGYDDGSITFGTGFGFDLWKVNSMLDFAFVLEDVAPDASVVFGWSVAF